MRILLPFVLSLLVFSCKPISQGEVMFLKRANTALDIFTTTDSLKPYWQEASKDRFYSRLSIQDATAGQKDLTKIAQEIAIDYSQFNEAVLGISGLLLEVKDTSVLQRLEELYTKQRKKEVLAYLIATQYEKRQKDEKAMEWIGKAIVINPYVEAYLVLQANLFQRSKKNKEAIETLDRITTFTEEPWHYFYMAYLLNRSAKQDKQALVSLDSTIASLKKFQQERKINSADSLDQKRQLAGYEKEREELVLLKK